MAPRASIGVLPPTLGFVPQCNLTLPGATVTTTSTTFVDFGVNTGMGYTKRFGPARTSLLVRMTWVSFVQSGSSITQDTGVRVNGQDLSFGTYLFGQTSVRIPQTGELLITGLPAQGHWIQPRWRTVTAATLATDPSLYINLYVCEVWTGA